MLLPFLARLTKRLTRHSAHRQRPMVSRWPRRLPRRSSAASAPSSRKPARRWTSPLRLGPIEDRVLPKRAMGLGYAFKFPEIEGAMRDAASSLT